MEQKLFFIQLATIIAVFLVSFSPALAQRGPLDSAVKTITEADMAREINLLSHDSLAGRNTPGPEIEKAASYLAERFRDLGLEPAGEEGTFIHRYIFEPTRFIADSVIVKMKGSDIRVRHGFDYFMTSGAPPIEGEVLYAGVAGEEYPLENVEGKILVFDLPGSSVDGDWFKRMGDATQFSIKNGALGVLFILDPSFLPFRINYPALRMAESQLPIPVVGMTYNAVKELFSSSDIDLDVLRTKAGNTPEGKKLLQIQHQLALDTITAPNVVAMLRGANPDLNDTYLVITAHYDHIGLGAPDSKGDSIFNGANDNASGTAALLELAEAFAALPEPPDRSIIFLAVSGEERGLLGSKAYVADTPGFDIENIIANLNMDMIGSQAPDTIISIGQEYSSLQVLLDNTIKEHPGLGLSVALDNFKESGVPKIAASDQWSFVKEKIPVIFLHDGASDGDSEYYHTPEDEAIKIDFDKAARVTRLAFYLAHAMAMDPQKPAWTEEGWAEIEKLIELHQPN